MSCRRRRTADNRSGAGLEPAESIEDKTEFSCLQRGSILHWSALILCCSPYLEDVHKVGEYDVAFVGVPFDIAATFRTEHGLARKDAPDLSALPEV
jgi:agmatinase